MTRIQPSDTEFKITGEVTSGEEKAQYFLSKSGYTEQFIEQLGYEPFAGTLNLELDSDSASARSKLDDIDPVLIEKWSDGDNTYGAVFCYPAAIEDESNNTPFSPCHVIVPKRTDHGRDVLEVIAPESLREELGVSDGDKLTVKVLEQ